MATDKLYFTELKGMDDTKRKDIIKKHIAGGVIIPFTDGVVIGENAVIEANTLIFGGCVILGESKIGKDCIIGSGSFIYQSTVGSGSVLNNVQCFCSVIGENADIGPFVHIRPKSSIAEKVHLGNFVEVKNSLIGGGTKVSHLTYVGDSLVGKGVNFGCGCVTVNFDGKAKHRTVIEDGAFIGCNTNLVAPVKIGKRAYTAAGTTVTEDVPENALAIGRARQTNKAGWVKAKNPYRE